MQIDDKLISYLEELSFLTLSADERDRLKEDMPPVIDCMSQLEKINTDGVPECSNPLDNVNVFREDETYPSYDRELILKNAPVRNDEMIIAPKTVD